MAPDINSKEPARGHSSRRSASVLTDQEIRAAVEAFSLITPFEGPCIQGASYDCRLGPQYVKHGEVRTLTEHQPTIVLVPGEFALLTSLEVLRLPLDMIGHNGLMSFWAKRGLVSLFSPQIDPGFVGMLIVPVFNAGDSSVSIQLGERIFTLEFISLGRSASWGWSERNGEQLSITSLSTPAVSRPTLSDVGALRKDLNELQEKVSRLFNERQVAAAEEAAAMSGVRASLQVLENRFNDLLQNKSLRFTRQNLLIAVIATVFTVLGAFLPEILKWFVKFLEGLVRQ
jgi:deoxycytidine triphosphate deaminase